MAALAGPAIEQRRDLLWSRQNAPRVAQVLRAVSYKPEDRLFRSEKAYLRLRVIIRQLEAMTARDGLDEAERDEIAQALWDLGVLLEDGDLGDALESEPRPEFLLLGTGAKLVQPPAAFRRAMEEHGIGIEAMDSRAAARTLALLRAEERWVVAALYPLG